LYLTGTNMGWDSTNGTIMPVGDECYLRDYFIYNATKEVVFENYRVPRIR